MTVSAGHDRSHDDWFLRNTFGHETFAVDDLAARKRAAGIRTSVVVPAREEAATIAGVVEAVSRLRGILVDEIVVVDASSVDGTAAVARAAGATSYDERELVADLGPVLGKGDAMWRSLTATSGDLVVFMDADIRNPGPHFVASVLGPLLTRPELQLVKGFYRRPFETATVSQPDEGGRVTELCARPLLNAFWPDLAWLVQPLSGEFGARRELLESVPFCTGYGVEIGLLIDAYTHAGREAIAQVDLRERRHRHQPVAALSRMAFEITQAAMRRLARQRQLTLPDADVGRYVQFRPAVVGPEPVERTVNVIERPPMVRFRAGRHVGVPTDADRGDDASPSRT